MRTMFDGITPAEVPAGAQLYAAYLDGNWADYPAMVARYPNAVHVSIAVSASYDGGQVIDVENGDATPAESVTWVQARRRAGADPTVYCSMSTWPSVKSAFSSRGVAQPHYWIADYSLGDNPAIPAGAIALQYADRGGYDVSVVADYWPGVDAAAPPPPSAPSQEDDMPYLISVTPDPSVPGETKPTAGIFLVDGGAVAHVDPASYGALAARFGAPIVVSPTFYSALLAAGSSSSKTVFPEPIAAPASATADGSPNVIPPQADQATADA
ncbi:MAG TPA: hypothetical protein VGX23_10360 [Actinocrinis sp.]|nr:hypothetical protein [Actinocrinis sp.]